MKNVLISPDRLWMDVMAPDFIEKDLSRPDRIDWPDTWLELATLRKEMQSRLPQAHRPLMDLSLAAHFLMTSSVPEEFLDVWDTGLLPKTIFNGDSRWRLAPVALVREEMGVVRYVMVGAGKGIPGDAHWPDWATAHLSDNSQEAILDAFDAARTLSGVDDPLFMFPLAVPSVPSHIEGRSLGLPLCLAALSALTGEIIALDVLATGDVRPQAPGFPIDAVSGIPAKIEAMRKEHLRFMLIPKSAVQTAPSLPNTLCRPVIDLREAWLWARLYAPGQEKKLETLNHMQNDPEYLVNNCLSVTPDMLKWLMDSEHGKCLCDAIVSNIDLIKGLVDKLKNCLEPADRDLNYAAAISGIVREDTLSIVAECSPLSAFKWAVLNLKRVNHLGDNDRSLFWKRRAAELQDAAKRIDPCKYSDFVNNLLVTYHNKYKFCPELPLEFKEAMEEEERCKRGNSPVLGEMYGTLTQNYGFCGPEYLEEVCCFVRKAQAEFDDGQTPEYRKDWLREFSFSIFAFLDAGRIEEARNSLWQYLEIESWNDMRPWSDLNSYEGFAFVRYLADAGAVRSDAGECDLASDLTTRLADADFEKGHPRQLIAHNLGRLALGSYPDLAKQYFEKSVKLCQESDDTIQAMALLPLSELHHAAFWTPNHEATAVSVRNAIRGSRCLNQAHFQPLTKGDIGQMLEAIWREPARIFPFSYR
jgi:hypothetical protein